MLIRTRPNLSAAHRERAHESPSSVSWTTHRQGCSSRSVPFLLFLECTLHPYDKHRRLHWHGPRWWSSSCRNPPHRRPHTASSSQINLNNYFLTLYLHMPLLLHAHHDCRELLPSNDYISLELRWLIMCSVFLTILLLMQSITSLPSLLYLLISTTFTNQDQLDLE